MKKVYMLRDMVMEVNSWDNSLEHLEFHYNDEDFFDTFYSDRPHEVARAIHFGAYNYMDEYVTLDVYGNLVSYSDYEVEEEVLAYESEIIERYKELVEDGSIEDYNNYLEEENWYEREIKSSSNMVLWYRRRI